MLSDGVRTLSWDRSNLLDANVEIDRTTPGSEVYLPPYSPDFNPIENVFAKLKAVMMPSVRPQAFGKRHDIHRVLEILL